MATESLRQILLQNAKGKLPKALHEGVGFAFDFGEEEFDPKAEEWPIATSSATELVFRHTSGLKVTRETVLHKDFAAIEFKVRFKNESDKALRPISKFRALDIWFDKSVISGNSVVSSGGGLADGYLPPRSFALRQSYFSPTAPDMGAVHLTTEGGRSSNKDLPFFFVHNDELDEGAFVAFGWSGQWEAFVALHMPKETLRVWGKIPELEIALEPGEELLGPSILVGFYQGNLSDGSNRLRRLLRDRYIPKVSGRSFTPIATFDHWWHIRVNFDEHLLAKLAEGAAALDQEYFLLDAGWYEGDGWYSSIGNWEVNSKRLPNGLPAFADFIRSKGLKFGLWFEPERVARGTRLAQQHPDWILWDHAAPTQLNQRPFPESMPGLTATPYLVDGKTQHEGLTDCGLLNYGLSAVQDWAVNMMSRYIKECGIEYIRYDFNMEPLQFWRAADVPGRRGVTQIKHVQGFYSVIDRIRELHPETVLEGCASGGRRIDLETVRRFHTAWISDHTVDPSIVRFHLHGINHFLPGSYAYVQYVLPSGYQDQFQPDDIGFQSMFGGSFGTGGPVHNWSDELTARARTHIALWKKLRRYLVEDFYALTPQPTRPDSWSAWQFHDPVQQSGFVQTFRMRGAEDRHVVRLRGLNEAASYVVTDAYTGERSKVAGANACNVGLPVSQAQMTSRVFLYERAG
ncbi:alpha-galactosidase [Bradyrhizobium sp. S3.12.5]|uniref:alpha-galactosidase n=1 Tax=Bradyrhizobium sp. S3.12.5 TaxID=3156386 RepID=UPI0033965241